MQRCLELAERGAGYVAPNPMVGAVLVYQDRIIGEGWHEAYGKAHAEVNCILSVKERDRKLISQSCLYISLEPCAHYGKTPPCADLIVANKIPEVVIGCRDSFAAVNGKGISILKDAAIKVTVGVMEPQCIDINKRFFTFHTKQRPYIILKWAQTADGFIGYINENSGANVKPERLLISNSFSNALVHKWRSEEAAIIVGTNTALIDDPALTTRLHTGKSPVRLVIDMHLRLPSSLQIFSPTESVIVFNGKKESNEGNVLFYRLLKEEELLPQICAALFKLKIMSVIVEGGAILLQSFIAANLWDEARVIQNDALLIKNGLHSPVLTNAVLVEKSKVQSDVISIYLNK